MKRSLPISVLLFCSFMTFAGSRISDKQLQRTLDLSLEQAMRLYNEVKVFPDKLPRTIDQKGKLVISNDKWWTSGFFPGTLWYLYESSGKKEVEDAAMELTRRVINQQYTTDNHDVGFMIYCSFGNALRITGDKTNESVIINAAKSLSTRFNPVTGCIKSWNNIKWQYPVIIDNMMNLELLVNATRISGDSSYLKIAETHANTTLKNHFRPDGSSYHVVSYDTIKGGFVDRVTFQGSHNESAWARGQAWGLYGYVMMYRETKKPAYLQHAQKIAGFIMQHKNLPKDKIPYWDFDAPQIPNTLRDASAGAVMASAFLELSTLVDKKSGKKYFDIGQAQLKSLMSPVYFAKPGENGNFILKHSVGFMARNNEVDVPLTYADYYFLEALLKYKKMTKK
ncbi:MAG: glycoside hydrolase family 88 protein [Paludibacter sp.]|nr:glycoside hydrolase family 88 protein [Paludibacter sp.]